MRHVTCLFTALLCSLVPLTAQTHGKPANGKPAAAPAKELRVHVIGASVSGGFRDGPMFGAKEKGDSVTLQYVLEHWIGDEARATTHSTGQMLFMFQDPMGMGELQLQGVLKKPPDVVVGIDFLIWFAYGPCHEPGPEGDAGARKAKVAAGLEMIGRLKMPVLLGDLPDMHGAAPRMLQASWIPAPEVLKQLNEQIAAFVAEHENLHLFPLAELVAMMKDKGVALPLSDGALQTAPGALLQGDRLHATRLGMAYLGYCLQGPLSGLCPAGHALHGRKWTIEQFVEACGAEGDLELVQAAASKVGAGK
ncbi:MAG TPA: hypothetical protein VFZ65_02265 [Planctomycetota bacterium]|nr:hypothetical protein [Planctomycetota bacterium]